jgi:hypothetical protein
MWLRVVCLFKNVLDIAYAGGSRIHIQPLYRKSQFMQNLNNKFSVPVVTKTASEEYR